MKKSKRIKKSNSWKIKQHRDQFFKKSKTLGYRSRASFKLIELNKKYKFINKNTNLLDLGSCPGSWTQVASQIIKEGKIMSIDIKDMQPIKNIKFFKGNILEDLTKREVIKYFKAQKRSSELIISIVSLLKNWLPFYLQKERSYFCISIGCTGGKHRSVFCVEEIAKELKQDWTTSIRHINL